MNGKRYIALPLCACGCKQRVKNFRARYLPGHHTKELKGEIAISAGLKRNDNEINFGNS